MVEGGKWAFRVLLRTTKRMGLMETQLQESCKRNVRWIAQSKEQFFSLRSNFGQPRRGNQDFFRDGQLVAEENDGGGTVKFERRKSLGGEKGERKPGVSAADGACPLQKWKCVAHQTCSLSLACTHTRTHTPLQTFYTPT